MIRIRHLALALLPLPLPLLAETGPMAGAASLSALAPRDHAPSVQSPAAQDLAPQIPASQSDVLRAELRPGWREADGRYMAALHLSLAPQWKTYWRAPGDAGIPPEFDWSGSQNLQSVTVHWPRPEVFDYQGMQTIGYRQEVVLPVEVTPQDPAQPVKLDVSVELGICKDICMPAALTLQQPLPPAGGPDPVITAALARRPLTAAEAGVTRLGCTVEPIADGLRLIARLEMPRLPGAGTAAETVVMEPAGQVWVSDTAVQRDGRALTATAEIVPPRGSRYQFDPATLRLTVLADGRAVEMTGCPLN